MIPSFFFFFFDFLLLLNYNIFKTFCQLLFKTFFCFFLLLVISFLYIYYIIYLTLCQCFFYKFDGFFYLPISYNILQYPVLHECSNIFFQKNPCKSNAFFQLSYRLPLSFTLCIHYSTPQRQLQYTKCTKILLKVCEIC